MASSTIDSIHSSIITQLNTFLDPKLHQVIGSTPESLKSSVQLAGLEGKPDLGFKFIALSVFACSVNKPTVEQYFIEEKFSDLRPIASRAFILNGKVNMTALSLAGHCFMTINALSTVRYIAEMRKKIGQDSIWDGQLLAGSLSDTQRKIFQEKAKTHTKVAATEFASWFLIYTGLVGDARGRDQSEAAGGQQSRRGESRGALEYNIPGDLSEYYFTTRGRSQDDMDKLVRDHGVSGAIDRIVQDKNRYERRARGDGSTVIT
jgi:hypothetical protein